MPKRLRSLLLASCALLAWSCLFTERASAQHIYAGLLGGYAASTEQQNGVEPFGLGGGASAGVSLPLIPFYVGARIVYYAGESDEVGSGAGKLELDSHYMLYGLDLGFDAGVGPVTFRPGLGIGSASLRNSGTAIGVTVTGDDSSLYLAPNVGLILTSGLIYLGAELRMNFLVEDAHNDSMSMLASFGFTL